MPLLVKTAETQSGVLPHVVAHRQKRNHFGALSQ